jgi:hypothetical protein
VKIFISDKDGGIKSHFTKEERLKHILLLNDAGHDSKSIKKKLIKIFGTGKQYGPYVKRILSWWKRCLSEARRAVDPTLPLLERKDLVTDEFLSRWLFTVLHYSQEVCSIQCPCRRLTTVAMVQGQAMDLGILRILPSEILLHIFSFFGGIQDADAAFKYRLRLQNPGELTEPSKEEVEGAKRHFVAEVTFLAAAYTCKSFYLLCHDTSLAHLFRHRPKKELLQPTDPSDAAKLLELSDLTMEVWSGSSSLAVVGDTTQNESLHARMASFAPKRINFWKNYGDRAGIAVAATNFRGVGEVTVRTMTQLKLPVPSSLAKVLQKEDEQQKKQAEVKKSIKYKIRQGELERNKAKRKVEEKEVSKKRRLNEYKSFKGIHDPEPTTSLLLANQAKAPRKRKRKELPVLDAYPTDENTINKLKGTSLSAYEKHFLLRSSVEGEKSVKARRARLLEFVKNPDMYQNYLKVKKTEKGKGPYQTKTTAKVYEYEEYSHEEDTHKEDNNKEDNYEQYSVEEYRVEEYRVEEDSHEELI